jgi:hypothetical protein
MIFAFVGLPGTGKTLSMVHHVTDKVRRGERVYTNNPIKILLSKNQPIFLSNKQLLERMIFEDHATFLIDEAEIVFDPYQWNRTDPFFLYKFAQGRKLHMDILYTVQRFNQVLKRLRELTNFIIKCSSPFPGIFHNIWYDPEIWDKTHLFGTPMEEKYVVQSSWILPWEVKKVYTEYNHEYLVKPFNAGDFQRTLQTYKKDEDGLYIKPQEDTIIKTYESAEKFNFAVGSAEKLANALKDSI